MTHLPDKFYIAAGCSVGLIAVSLVLAGVHRDIAWHWNEYRSRLRRRRRGGFLHGGDR